MEKVVLDGHGGKLLHETSTLEKVTKFIYALPDFMVCILKCIADQHAKVSLGNRIYLNEKDLKSYFIARYKEDIDD